jgi:hypothetical protein
MLENLKGYNFFISYGQAVYAKLGQDELRKDTMRGKQRKDKE